jgi:signal peptidase
MRQTIWLMLIVLTVGFSIFYLRTWVPFMGISGNSMKPELNPGDLIFIEEVSPQEIREGDVIIFEVPSLVRETYKYPLVVAHRVVKINTKNNVITFNTQGDNLGGPDPFTVRTVDLRGEVGKRIPFLGFLLLFLQSKQGLISVAVILLLIGLGTYSREIGLMKRRVQREIFSPVLEEQKETKQALTGFASAMAEYAKHLGSHTKAVQDLAKTTGKLVDVVERLDKKLSGEEESNKKSG